MIMVKEQADRSEFAISYRQEPIYERGKDGTIVTGFLMVPDHKGLLLVDRFQKLSELLEGDAQELPHKPSES